MQRICYFYFMDALDVISLDDAKNELNITWTLSAGDIKILTRCIKTAVSWIETYTDYYLYERDLTIDSLACGNRVFIYPVSIINVKDSDGNVLPTDDYDIKVFPLYTAIYAGCDNTIDLKVGYSEASQSDIPQQLISACMKLITYLYENRDAYPTELPIDIQLLVNQLRRNISFS